MKDWRSVALLALASILLGRESARTDNPPHRAADQFFSVRIVEPIQVRVVDATDPSPRPGPSPAPEPTPGPDTALAKAGRDYLRMIPIGLPGVWNELADRVERGEIADKSAAVKFHGQLSTSMNTALDQLFAPGVDARGKITNRGVIVAPLRQSATALGRPD